VKPFARFSDVYFLSDTKSILKLNAKVSHCAVDFRMTEQKLHST
jgi:hypothetical protein